MAIPEKPAETFSSSSNDGRREAGSNGDFFDFRTS